MSEQAVYEDIERQCNSSGEQLHVARLLARGCRLFPYNLALITPQARVTYKELYYRAILMSNLLARCGVTPHDRVVLLYENSVEFYIAYFGILQTGATCVPVNTFLHERELGYIINDATPKIIIASPHQLGVVAKAYAQGYATHQAGTLSADDFDAVATVPDVVDESLFQFPPYLRSIDELTLLLYTSGTTGIPKGVMLSSRNAMTNAMQGYARFTMCGMKQQERFFCVLPLFHVFAQNVCLLLPALIGAAVIVVPKIDRKLILDALAEKPTLFLGVPPLFGLLCLMRTAPLSSVKLFISGADMLPDKIRAAFAVIYGRNICAGYGLSEASPVVAVNHETPAQPTQSVGKPLAGIECQIRDSQGMLMTTGSIGSLWVKGDNVMLGYYNAPEATAQVLQDGWLNTGDLAYLDKHGNLAICGRSKDIIIHKGFNIYPAEIENILMMHPAVVKAAVIGQEEDMSGQVPIAFVAVRSRDAHLEQTLRTLCMHNLASYKIPRKFVCLDDLPMNATGKIDKKRLPTLMAP